MNRKALIAAIILITMAGGTYARFDAESYRGDRVSTSTRNIEESILDAASETSGGQVEAEPSEQKTNIDDQHVSRGGQCRIFMGEFKITAYTAGPESTGKRPGDPEYGITASGEKVEEGITIAADWDVLPKGTVVWIEGVGKRVVQDTGSAIKGNRIDVYFDDLDTALAFGRQKGKKVYIIE